jgi:hypothetical protein
MTNSATAEQKHNPAPTNAEIAQMNDLLETLDTGDNLHAHAVSQIDQRLDDRRRIAVNSMESTNICRS